MNMKPENQKRLCAGLVAHVDAGKTTLSEAMLYAAGSLRQLGRVDHGDSYLDTDAMERQRGITIYAKPARLSLPHTKLTLIDTPGHVDFAPETERTLRVQDCAVLVISGTDGVQSHTETMWRLLRRNGLPVILFVSKMDLPNAGRAALLRELRDKLSDRILDMTEADEVDPEELALCSEALLEDILSDGEAAPEHVSRAFEEGSLFPCVFGSGLQLDAVDRLLELLDTLPEEKRYPSEFGARVYKIARDARGERLTFLRVTGGSLQVRSSLSYTGRSGEQLTEKISSLRLYSGERYEQAESVPAGTVCAVAGLSGTWAGGGLGTEAAANPPLLQPVMDYCLRPIDGTQPRDAYRQLRLLEEEEPMLRLGWDEALQEIRVQIMGEVQMEVLCELIESRFGLKTELTQGSILYRETIASAVEGIGHFEPLRHYAEVHLLMEPGPRGSGLTYEADCPEGVLGLGWQRLALSHLAERTHLGVLTGSPITDIKFTLISGRAHVKHSEGADFREAVYRAVRQGLMQAENVLLEPWYDYRITLPAENVGHCIADLQLMGADFTQEVLPDGSACLSGQAPVSALQGYPLQLRAYTKGRGVLSCVPSGYGDCPNPDAVIAARGYRPESDLPNTADSVFCVHGAAALVRWDQVPEYAHVPLRHEAAPAEEDPEVRSWEQRAADYYAHVATDAELMRIFERTYGPVKRQTPQVMRTVKSASSASAGKPRKAETLPEGPEYLLVDGYNMIFAWEELTALAREDLEAARQTLIHRLCNYQGIRRCELILVFDAYRVKGNPGSVEQVGGISVVYTKEAETADMYIERVTHEVGRKRKVKVATSDGMIQIIILGHGALRVTASELHQEVIAAENAMRSFLEAGSGD